MNRAVYWHLFATFGRMPGVWAGFVLEALRTLFFRVIIVIIMAEVAKNVAAGDMEAAKMNIVVFVAMWVVASILALAAEWVLMYSTSMRYKAETELYYDKLTGKDMAFYRDTQTGYLVATFRQYLDNITRLSRFVTQDATRLAISLVVPAAILVAVDWRTGLTVIGVVLLQITYLAWASSRANEARRTSQKAYREMTGEVTDHITNIVAYKASGVAKRAKARIRQLSHTESYAYWRRYKLVALYDAPRNIATGVGAALAFYFAIEGAGSSVESVGVLVLAITYVFQITRQASDLISTMTVHDDLISKIYPTLAYLSDEHETIRDPKRPQALPSGAVGVAFEDVEFTYEAGSHGHASTVFRGLSLEVAPGEQVGIVGLSGAGKSTLAGLVMRFDDVTSGAIRVGGVDVRQLRQSDLHRAIAYVPQEPLLFHRSIRDNIAYFMDDVSDEQVVRAAKAAHAHEFIVELPQGYDTLVGERGIKLSGGQKQRVAIARAILKDAPITLFDEATSALDSESEAIIQRALPQILGKRTAIIIAHRLSTVAGLDRIIVLEKGKIIEEGAHEELLKQNGRYTSLWRKQTKDMLL